MKPYFKFDMNLLTLEDQKKVFHYFFPEIYPEEKLAQAKSLADIIDIENVDQDPDFEFTYYPDVILLARFAALFAFGLAWISYEPYPPTNQTLVDVAFNFDFDTDFDFDHYQHLNKEGDYICLIETVEMFGILEIKDIFKPYHFWLDDGRRECSDL